MSNDRKVRTRVQCTTPDELREVSRTPASPNGPATKLCVVLKDGTYFIEGITVHLTEGQHVRMPVDAYARYVTNTKF